MVDLRRSAPYLRGGGIPPLLPDTTRYRRESHPAMTKSPRAGVTLIELLVAMTLLSLLAVGVLFGLRIGLGAMERTNNRLQTNRKVLGVERVLTQQIAG